MISLEDIKAETTDDCQTLTIQEAAKILGIGKSMAYKAAKAGDIPTVRIGKRLLVSRPALEHMLHIAKPDDTLKYVIDILQNIQTTLIDLKTEIYGQKTSNKEITYPVDPIFLEPINTLALTKHTINLLASDGVYNIGDLVQRTELQLLDIPNLGRNSLMNIKGALADRSLSLGMYLTTGNQYD